MTRRTKQRCRWNDGADSWCLRFDDECIGVCSSWEAVPPCLYSDGNGGCRTMPGVPAQATPCDKPKKPCTCRMYKPGGQP